MPPFDMSLVQRGARLRRSPFYEAEQRHGPRGYTVYNHMLFPTNYDDFEAEYWHLLNHVTLWDVAVERCLEVSGRDGLRLAQMMTPRDLSTCAVGQAKYVLICAADGGLHDPGRGPDEERGDYGRIRLACSHRRHEDAAQDAALAGSEAQVTRVTPPSAPDSATA
jgi:glycine cleavage system aminomethyltransferase T